MARAGEVAACESLGVNTGARAAISEYLDYTGRDDVGSGGARMIRIVTPSGPCGVWTKRIGNNPDLKVLVAARRSRRDARVPRGFDSYLPAAGVEYYYYDQLGSGRSDQPDDESLWDLDRFVDEVEQVRSALGLDRSNFVLYGQSWGGILAIEYALPHQEHLRGLVISNMMASVPAYNAYAEQVLMPQMDQARSPRSSGSSERGPRRTRATCSCSTSTTTFTTSCVCRWRNGLIRCSADLPTSTQSSTARCRDPASSESAAASLAQWDRSTIWHDRRADPGHRRPARHHGSRRTCG